MKLIPLSQGKKGYPTPKHAGKYFAKVDDADYDWLNQFQWAAIKKKDKIYASKENKDPTRPAKKISMHRFILDARDPKIEIDHKDHDTLNNQRDNLRESTKAQNAMNKTSRVGASSKYLGVFRHVTKSKWVRKDGTVSSAIYVNWLASIKANGKQISLGTYKSEEDAAKAYDEAALKYHGEFANPNFPQNLVCQK